MTFWQLVFAHPVASFFLLLAAPYLIAAPIEAWRSGSCDCKKDDL